MQVIRRILAELRHVPASRLAAILTAEGIHSPDHGRIRKDRGVYHQTSGAWHSNTITNIAQNPPLRAVVSHGRRSMGKHLRFAGERPRELEDDDFRADSKPKVIRNDAAQHVVAEASFESLVDAQEHSELLEILEARSGTQRGKPRSSDPGRNPLGGRIFDWDCAWPMYRVPKKEAYAYSCGAYMQSHGALCAHNKVDGPTATGITVDFIRQRLSSPNAIDRLRSRLLELAQAEMRSPKEPLVTASKDFHSSLTR